MKIVAAADHGGFEMKNQIVEDLRKQGFAVEDLGTNSADSVDYPDFAEKATAKVLAGQADLGILVCGTGIGISIAANRHKGIRAAILYDDYVAKVAREHNNANVLCFGGRTVFSVRCFSCGVFCAVFSGRCLPFVRSGILRRPVFCPAYFLLSRK